MYDLKRVKHFSILLERLKKPNGYNILEINQSVEDIKQFFIKNSEAELDISYFSSFNYLTILTDGYAEFQQKLNYLLEK